MTFCLVVAILAASPSIACAWNIPGHMLSGAIAYQILRKESASTITTVKAILEKHPWFESHWKEQLDKIPDSERDEMLFMLAPRWADDIRTKDRAQHRQPWHYINYPFKPKGQPESVQPKPPQAVNILTALVENERIANNDTEPARKAIALTWLFHLVGDIHQPLHSTQLFTSDYPNGDRGGNLVCVRPTSKSKPMDLHRFWDGVITSSNNVTRLRNEATTLINRPEFAKDQLTELGRTNFESWAKESFEIATKISYQNGAVPGTPKGNHKDCGEIADAGVLPTGYAKIAARIADRRIVLAGYRLTGNAETGRRSLKPICVGQTQRELSCYFKEARQPSATASRGVA